MKLASPLRRLLVGLLERLAKRVLPDDPDDTDPIPLTHRSVENIQQQIRSATEKRPLPPPPPSSRTRYDD